MAHRTEHEAFELVMQARVGCFSDANVNYLCALRRHVAAWLDDIDDEIAKTGD